MFIIFIDFVLHLQKIHQQYASFKYKALTDWNYYAWQGFYSYLKDHFNNGDWGYVENPSGGFFGYRWYFKEMDNYKIHLMLEESKLCYKIIVRNEKLRKKLLKQWHEIIMSQSQLFGLHLKKPDKYANQEELTVAVLDIEYRQTDKNNQLDINKTIEILKKAELLLDEAVKKQKTLPKAL